MQLLLAFPRRSWKCVLGLGGWRRRPWSLVDHGNARTHGIMSCADAPREALCCLLSPVSCPLSPVSCPLSPVSCPLSPVSCLQSPVPCLLSPAFGGAAAPLCASAPLRESPYFFVPWCLGGSTPLSIAGMRISECGLKTGKITGRMPVAPWHFQCGTGIPARDLHWKSPRAGCPWHLVLRAEQALPPNAGGQDAQYCCFRACPGFSIGSPWPGRKTRIPGSNRPAGTRPPPSPYPSPLAGGEGTPGEADGLAFSLPPRCGGRGKDLPGR